MTARMALTALPMKKDSNRVSDPDWNIVKSNAVVCQFCGQGSEIEDIAGNLHAEQAESGKLISAHHRCMQYASALAQYKTDEFGGFDIEEVEKEINRGKKLRCSVCKSKAKNCRGASCGCAVRSCRKSYHYPCAFKDPSTVTKRLVVTTNKNTNSKEKFVYYRVFCSKDHELAFREQLKEELRDGKTKRKKRGRESDEQDDLSQGEEEEMGSAGSNASTTRHNISVASFRSPVTDPIPAPLDDGAYLQAPLAVDSKALSPGQKLLLSFASNLNSHEAAETRTRNSTSRLQEEASGSQGNASPWQVLAISERQSGAVNATVIVHDQANQRHVEKLDEDPNLNRMTEAGDFKAGDIEGVQSSPVPPGKTTRSTRSAASQGLLTAASSDANQELVSDKHKRRSPRKNVELNSNTKTYDDHRVPSHVNSVTPQPSPPIPAQKSPKIPQQQRQRAVGEMTSQNGHAARDFLSDAVSDIDTSHESTRSSARLSWSRRAELRNDTGLSVGQKARQLAVVSEKSGSEQAGTSGVSGNDGMSDTSKRSRKRKADDEEARRNMSTPDAKISTGESTDSKNLAYILLIPSNMGEFKRLESLVMDKVTNGLKVKTDNVCVWQGVVKRSLPSELLMFFMLELVMELRHENSETLLNLLFDEGYLTSRESGYGVQAKVFHSLKDENSQKDLQMAVWGGLERNVKDLPMVRLLRLPDHNLVTLAIDVRQCHDSRKVQAFLQAHKGLCWWDRHTEPASLHLSPSSRTQAAQAEAWTWQVWLTKVCPVSDITVVPAESYILDRKRQADNPALQSLVQCLKESTSSVKGSKCGQALLLVFQHVDLNLLNFRLYFRKVCVDVLQSRPSGTLLALVPLDNFQDRSYESVCGLMRGGERSDVEYGVSVRSAFSPRFHLTKLVVLEITTFASEHSGFGMTQVQADSDSTESSAKRPRGRPRKHPETPE